MLSIEGYDSGCPNLAFGFRQCGCPELCEIVSNLRMNNFLGINGTVEEVGVFCCSCWCLVLLLVVRLC